MSAEEIFKAMDAGENRLAAKIRQIVRRFINKIPRENLGAVTLGQTYKWWGEEVDAGLLTTIRGIWLDGYYVQRVNGIIEKSSLDGLESYMARVNDRLVRGLDPPLPEAAFNFVRQAIVTGAVQGWSRDKTAEYIAALLSWETDGDYWRKFKSEVDEKIDSILDPLGAPGTQSREMAKSHDPRVVQLRDQRNLATKHLDDERSYWERRAMAIARTESTAAFNYASLVALEDEGFAYKEWMATRDLRTRAAHRAADGQKVPLRSPFIVGDSRLQMPGDPTGDPAMTVNCRCAIIGSDG